MLNKVTLIGNLGQDPEVRYTQAGTPVANFSLATTEKWKGHDGQVQEHTEWHKIVAFNRLAEICGEYLGKGSKIYVEGRIQTRAWEDKDGIKRYTTEIVAREMKMLESKGNGGGAGKHPTDTQYDRGEPMPEPRMGDDVPF